MAGLALNGVAKAYGEVQALKDISLEVAEGEFLCVLGPSGAGKTTMLRVIAGLEELDAGSVHLGEVDVSAERPGLRDVAMFFDNLSLYPQKTIRENLAFPLRMRRIPKPEMDRRVEAIAELLEISHTLDRRPETLSGGERQRVAFGRVMIRSAGVYLLDEPLSNLDALLRFQMRSELKRLQADFGYTTVYATPDPLEAMAVADRIVVLDGGQIQQVGTPEEIYNSPANEMVATFVGNPPINLIPVEHRREAGRLILSAEGFEFGLASEGPAGTPERRLKLGVRPEDIRLSSNGSNATAEVFALEPLGSKTVVDLMLGEVLVKLVQRGYSDLEIGSTVSISFDLDNVHLIDRDTGRVLKR